MNLAYRPRKELNCSTIAFQDFVDPPIAGEFVRSLCEEDTSQNGEFLYGALRVSDMSLFRHGVAARVCNTSRQQHTQTDPGVAAFLHGGVHAHPYSLPGVSRRAKRPLYP